MLSVVRMVRRLVALLLITGSASALSAFPDKPVRIIVPFQAGGAGDAAARILAEGLSSRLRQNVIVENRPGASGIIGTQAAMSAAPDGYTLLLAHTDTEVLNPQTHRKLPYSTRIPMEPVALISKLPGVLVARPGLGIASGQELIQRAKERPGQVTLGSWGIGSAVHVGQLMMEKSAGITLQHVPYQGAAAAVAQLLGGQLDLAFVTPAFAQGASATGKVRIIGASSAQRLALAPNIATLAEQGFTGIDLDTWYGLMAPPGTPLDIRQQLHEEVNAVLNQPAIAQKLREGGHEPSPMSMRQFADFITSETDRWGQLIRERKIVIDDL